MDSLRRLGSVMLLITMLGALGAIVVATSLGAGSGGLVRQIDSVGPYDTTVAIRFNTDGTIETGLSLNGGVMSWSSAGSWITPNGDASSVYDVRFTNFVSGGGGADWTTEAAADDTWIDLGTLRLWEQNKTSSGTHSFTCDFEVRNGGGAPPATASSSYTFNCDNVV